MPITIPKIKLNNGHEIPMLGLGTYKSRKGDVYRAVCDAIDIGYRYIDCAFAYENEAEIGQAIERKIDQRVVKRKDLFITSKLWNTHRSKGMPQKSLEKTLTDLRLDYVDLYLIESDVDYVDVWKSLEESQRAGKVRSIGVSNFNHEQIDRLLREATVLPVVNQIENHGYFQLEKLCQYCACKGIVVTAYCPPAGVHRPSDFDGPSLMEPLDVKIIAMARGKSVAQVLLRFLVQCNIVVIPKSVREERILNNAQIFDFELTQGEMARIRDLDRGHRMFFSGSITRLVLREGMPSEKLTLGLDLRFDLVLTSQSVLYLDESPIDVK